MSSSRNVFVTASLMCVIQLAAVSLPHTARGQEFTTGFYLGLGGGAGHVWLRGEGVLDGVSETIGMGQFRAGWFLTPMVALGLESAYYRRTTTIDGVEGDVRLTFSLSTLGVTLYPGLGRLFVRVGAGLAYIEASGSFGTVTVGRNPAGPVDDEGWGFLSALGYDIRLSRSFFLSPQVDYSYMNVGATAIRDADMLSGSLQLNILF